MNVTSLLKNLGLVAVTSLTVGAGLAQADSGYAGHPHKAGNPYLVASYDAHPGRGHHPGFRHDDDRYHRHGPDRFISGGVDNRQERQSDRIEMGVVRGEITRREAAKLYQQQHEIERMQRHFMADGRMTRSEYAALDQALDNAGRDIRHQANDNEWRW